MRLSMVVLCGAAIALSACSGEPTEEQASSSTSNTATQPKKRAYCFFPDEGSTKAWKLSVAKNGDLSVSGKSQAEDPRYMGKLGQPQISGSTAEIPLNMAPNDTGYRSADNGWWDVNATIPGSANVGTVNVVCGAKTLASLTAPKKR